VTSSVLSPLDTAFLRLESAAAPLHIASLAVFAGPPPTLAELIGLLASRLDQLPRYRQRVVEAPLSLGRPVWVDDPDFELARHVHAVRVPAPGGPDETRALCARLLERHLDRDRPLWETWLVDGMSDGTWGLLSKVHHCMVDGVAGTDVLAHVLDVEPGFPPIAEPAPWSPSPGPSWAQRVVAGLPRPRPSTAVRAVRDPRALGREVLTDLRGTRQWLSALVPVQANPLLGPVGKERDWLWVDVSLAEVRRVAHDLDGTVNDVAEALVCSALRELLLASGTPPQPRAIRSLVPVSVRRHGSAQDSALDANEVSALLALLPVDVADPHERFRQVRDELRRLKTSGQAQLGERITAAAGTVPPPLLRAGLVLGFRLPHQHLTTVTTNVPGPPIPLYGLGRELLALHPFVPIADRLRLGFAVTSYAGRLWFGITVDARHVHEASVLGPAITRALGDLMT